MVGITAILVQEVETNELRHEKNGLRVFRPGPT